MPNSEPTPAPTPAPTPDKLAEQFVQAVKRAAQRFGVGHFVIEFRIRRDHDSRLAAITLTDDPGEAAVASALLEAIKRALVDNADEYIDLADDARQHHEEEDHDDADD